MAPACGTIQGAFSLRSLKAVPDNPVLALGIGLVATALPS